MKKMFSMLMLVSVILFSGCSDDDDNGFDYDVNLLIGKWRVTHVEQKDGSYFDVTSSIAESVFEPTYATFNSNGTYSGSGEFGNGSGTYTAVGKTIITKVGGDEYLRYDVLALSGNECELKMYEKGDDASLKIKCKKQ
ncbi:MAG: lipocalin family protein [Bacteroidales bacterium]|jgi:hypothetical protein|nr:lipocalin family protein [Bacteroidales bacterium]